MTIQTTTHLPRHPRLARLVDRLASRLDIWTVLAVVLALSVVLVVARGRLATSGAPGPIIIEATPALPTVASVAVVQAMPGQLRTTRAVIAYDGELHPIGAIEPGRTYTPTAQLDETWLEADVAGSGIVRLKIAELFGVAELPPIVRTVEPDRREIEPPSAPIVEAAPPTYAPMNAAPSCWAGPPAPYHGEPECWKGVPFVQP